MCGRFTCLYTWDDIRVLLGLEWAELHNWPSNYNVAPSQQVPVVLNNSEGKPGLKAMTWGFPRISGKGPDLINARSETLRTRPTFRDAFNQRRCIVPVSGFYEWQQSTSGRKQPWSITPAESPILLLAGLWQHVQNTDRFVIVTAPAEGTMADIHQRTPVILRFDDADRWLNADPKVAALFLQNSSPHKLQFTPVSTRVNAVANNDPSLLRPVEPEADEQPGLFTP